MKYNGAYDLARVCFSHVQLPENMARLQLVFIF